MENSKSKAIIKPKNTSKGSKRVKNKKATLNKSKPSEEDIRKKAMEIYNRRIERDEYGTAEDDWLKAKELLKGSEDE
jgi:hypothetical protein